MYSIRADGGEVQVKDRRKAKKNLNVRTTKMGIFREVMNPRSSWKTKKSRGSKSSLIQ